MGWALWDRAVRIAGLRHLLHMVTAVRDLPDDDPHVARTRRGPGRDRRHPRRRHTETTGRREHGTDRT